MIVDQLPIDVENIVCYIYIFLIFQIDIRWCFNSSVLLVFHLETPKFS